MELKSHIDPKRCVYCAYDCSNPDAESIIIAFEQAIEQCRQDGIDRILLDYQTRTSYPAAVERIIVATELVNLYKSHLESGGSPIKFALFTRKNLITEDFQPGLEIARLEEMDLVNTDDETEILAWLAN